ncbi:MAG: hypothetical protein RRY64_07490 [Oscillospiraceae bacterium]
MYNRYIPASDAYSPIPEPEEHRPPGPPPSGDSPSAPKGPLSGITDLLGGFLKGFDLSQIDTGDILLVLIIVFLYLEGDNLELVITLGLLLLFGFTDKKKDAEEAD